MPLDARLSAFITAVGGDIKRLNGSQSVQAAQGITAWTDDPAIVSGTFRPSAGTVQLTLCRAALSIANGATVTYTVEVTGGGLTLSGVNGAAVYALSGSTLTLLGSVALGGMLTSTGVKTASGTLNATINPGDLLYLGTLNNGLTIPTYRAAPASTLINVGSRPRRAAFSSSTFPATIAASALVAATQAPFVAIG